MAPGCFTINQQNKEIREPATKTDILDFNITFNQHDLIDLNNQIPLPSTPHPSSFKKEITTETNRNILNDFNSTIDTFDLLEQTIIKQKKLARMKNTDLRLKILLKRTFDLVCELMDQESELEYERFSKEKDERVEKNVENEDSDSDSDSESFSSSSSSSSSDSDSDSDSESDSDSDEDSDDEEEEFSKCLKAYEANNLSQVFPETTQSELKPEANRSTNADASSSKEVKPLNEQTFSIREEEGTELDEHDRTILGDILEINININEFTESELLPLSEYKIDAQTSTNENQISKSFCIPIENNLRIYSLEPSTIEIEKILFTKKRKSSHQHNDQSLKNKKKLKPLIVSKKRRCSNDDDDETEQELNEFYYDQD